MEDSQSLDHSGDLTLDNIRLISGNSHKKLAKNISKILNKPLVNCSIKDFSNTEIKIDIHENIRNKHIFIIESGTYDYETKKSINDYFMETLIIIDACRRSLPIDSTQAIRKRTRAGMGPTVQYT